MASKDFARKIKELRLKHSPNLNQEEFHQRFQEFCQPTRCSLATYKKFEAGTHLSKALLNNFCQFVKANQSDRIELNGYFNKDENINFFDFKNRLKTNFPYQTHANFSGWWSTSHYNFSELEDGKLKVLSDLVVIEPDVRQGFFTCHRYYAYPEQSLYNNMYSGQGCYILQQDTVFAFLFFENTELCITTIKPPLPGQIMKESNTLQGLMLSMSINRHKQCVPAASRVVYEYLGKEDELIQAHHCDDRDGLLGKLLAISPSVYHTPEEFKHVEKIDNTIDKNHYPLNLRAWET